MLDLDLEYTEILGTINERLQTIVCTSLNGLLNSLSFVIGSNNTDYIYQHYLK